MRTEQQLDLNQQLSLDVNNYWGGTGGGVVVRGVSVYSQTQKKEKKKMSSFLAVYEAATFQNGTWFALFVSRLFCCLPPSPVRQSIRPYAVCGHAISDEIGLQEFAFFFRLFFFFFPPDRHLMPVKFEGWLVGRWWGQGGSQRAATKSSFWTGLLPDACSINSPSGERREEKESAVGRSDCGVVVLFFFSSLVLREGLCETKQCGRAEGYRGN